MARRIDPNLEKVVAYFQERLQEVSQGFQAQQGRPWMDLQELESTSKAEADLRKSFNRDEANADYVKARENRDAVSAEIMLSKLSGDFLAGFERDTRMRRRSRIRMMAHAASVAEGLGADTGPLRRNTVDWLQRIFVKTEEE